MKIKALRTQYFYWFLGNGVKTIRNRYFLSMVLFPDEFEFCWFLFLFAWVDEVFGRFNITAGYRLHFDSYFLWAFYILHFLELSQFFLIFIYQLAYFHLCHFCLYFILIFAHGILIQFFHLDIELFDRFWFGRFSNKRVYWRWLIQIIRLIQLFLWFWARIDISIPKIIHFWINWCV